MFGITFYPNIVKDNDEYWDQSEKYRKIEITLET